MERNRSTAGFTLVELLMVMAVTAILVAVAIPSFRGTIARSRAADASMSLQAAFELARSEAIRRNASVTICRSLTGNDAAAQCSNAAGGGFPGDDWGAGWLIFVDAPPLGAVDPGDLVLQRRQALSDGAGMRAFVVSNAGAAGEFYVFQGDGLRAAAGAATLRFAIDYREAGAAAPSPALRCLGVNLTGLAAPHEPTAGAC